MYRKLIQLLLALLVCVPAWAGTIPISGTVRLPNGALFNGNLRFTLSYGAARDATSNAIVVAQQVQFPVTNGALPVSARITPNDQLQPSNTVYTAEYISPAGSILGRNTFYIAGAAFVISQATPTPLTTSNISFGSFTGLDVVTAKKIGNVYNAGEYPGATASARIIAAMAATPSTGGTVSTDDLEGAQSWAACPFTGVSKPIRLIVGASTNTLSVDCAVPENITMELGQGAIISVASGKVLTIGGTITASDSQHFAGSGTVTFATGKISAIIAEWFGAKGDGTDTGTSIQAALNSVPSGSSTTNGGAVYFLGGHYVTSVALCVKSSTWIKGLAYGMVQSGPKPPTIIESTANDLLLQPCDNPSAGVKIENLSFYGTGLSGSRGIYATTETKGWVLRDLFFDQFGDEAIKLTTGAGGELDNLFVQDSLLIRTGRSNFVGAVDVGTTDTHWTNVQSTASVDSTTGNVGGGWIAACVNRGANSTMVGNTCHRSQVGLVVTASYIKLVANRTDNNQSYGYVIQGIKNTLTNNVSFADSRNADAGYPGFLVTNYGNSLSNNDVTALEGDPVLPSYGYQDTSNGGNGLSANHYSFNSAYPVRTAKKELSTGTTPKSWIDFEGTTLYATDALSTGHLIGHGSTPVIEAGVEACTSPTVTIAGTDLSGKITITTGTACPAGPSRIALITWAVTYATVPVVVFTPASLTSQALAKQPGALDSSATAAHFEFFGSGLVDATQYVWYYQVSQSLP